jgi:hypothetical protein
MMVKIRGYLLGGSGNHGLTSKYEAYQQESIIVHDDMNRGSNCPVWYGHLSISKPVNALSFVSNSCAAAV